MEINVEMAKKIKAPTVGLRFTHQVDGHTYEIYKVSDDRVYYGRIIKNEFSKNMLDDYGSATFELFERYSK